MASVVTINRPDVVALIEKAAEKLTKGDAHPEEDEKITPRIFTLKQVDLMIQRGTLHDAKSIVGLMYYMRYVRKFR